MPIRRDNRMTASKSPGIGEAAARPNPIEAVDPGGRRRITWGYSRRICSSLEAEDLEMRAKREPASRLSEFRSPYPGQIPNSVTPLTQFSLSLRVPERVGEKKVGRRWGICMHGGGPTSRTWN